MLGSVLIALDIATFICLVLIYAAYHVVCRRDAMLLVCIPPCSALLSLLPLIFLSSFANIDAGIHIILAALYSCIGYGLLWTVNKKRRNRGIAPAPMRYMFPAILVSGPVCFILMASIFFGVSLLISPRF